ncbi:MAG: chemotaxis-specific protein-glutamate methyltransferase CheB [Anaerolineae bacterium]|nr:chemotaxis-specific protein-glutamate methyltransferase CheB [Anaerolineae bacterium]
MLRVLIVDDSPTQRLLIRAVLQSDPDITVIGEAGSGEAAREQAKLIKPDLITMDINMPGMGGFEAIRHIMSETPCPIVVLTAMDTGQLSGVTFRALELGALTALPKPRGLPQEDIRARQLIAQVKLMAGVKVVRRTLAAHRPSPSPSQPLRQPKKPIRLVVVGASTGGPPALQQLLSALPPDFPVPIAAVQHIARGFVSGLAQWLSETTPIRCQVAGQDEIPQPGRLYLAPDDYHLTVKASGLLWLSTAPPQRGLRPCVNALFESAAHHLKESALGVLLTGMGEDGAAGLLAMRQAGAYTIAQDEASSVVYGMPKAAADLGAALESLPLDQIAARLNMLVRGRETAL